jgi:hypothetical protein
LGRGLWWTLANRLLNMLPKLLQQQSDAQTKLLLSQVLFRDGIRELRAEAIVFFSATLARSSFAAASSSSLSASSSLRLSIFNFSVSLWSLLSAFSSFT